MLVKRCEDNPILKPKRNHSWEANAVFNGCPVADERGVRLVYRAVSLPHYCTIAQRRLAVSQIGVANSSDGVEFHDRRRLIIPEKRWERYGCEDPRVTKLDGKYYIFYTALSTYPFTPEGIKIGLAISDDLSSVREKHLVTPFNAKAMALFPEKINGKFWAILTVNTDKPPSSICIASFKEEREMWDKNFWRAWHSDIEKHSLHLRRGELDQVEVGAQPIKTEKGWLVIYSYIRDYRGHDRLFTVEAALLDLKNPQKVISRFEMPLLVPEEYYENIGLVPGVIFPSGAFVREGKVYLYYGAADTTCCLAFIDLHSLLDKMTNKSAGRGFRRLKAPLLNPSKKEWESKAVFNPGVIQLDGKVHLLYRAMSDDNTSVLGYARSDDGKTITYRSPVPAYVPRMGFEQKLGSGNSGCEDPRLTLMGNRIYMTYTAFDGKNPPRVALTSIRVSDFLKERWKWEKPILISPPGLDDKDACIFPEKINGKYFIIHRSGEDIDSALVDNLQFGKGNWLDEYRWILPRKGWWDSVKVGLAAPPFKTDEGWVMLYHGVSDEGVYRVGAVLLDLKNPLEVISRTDWPLLEPQEPEEERIVFPCGAALIKDKVFIYYGADDKKVCAAYMKVKDLLKELKRTS